MHHMCGVGDKHLVAGSSVALVLDTSCCSGTFVYCTRDLFRVDVLSVAVMMGSAVALTQLCVVCGNH